jgi:putative PIN family toxin of toxin-antitoxin system
MALGFVLDTNVFVSALISRRGTSYRLLMLVGTGRFDVHISVPLILEYEGTAKRLAGSEIPLSEQEIDDVIDYICMEAEHHQVHFLWRPFLNDASDDMVVELAVSAACEYIVTFNLDDFQGIEQFGIEAITPQKALELIGELR